MRPSSLLHLAWSLPLPLLALTAVMTTPPERRLFMVVPAALVFALMQWVVPSCRFRTVHYFSPVNVALVLLLVKTLVAPVLVMAVGATNDLFVAVPSRGSMNAAILIDLVAYIALSIGLTFVPSQAPNGSSALRILSRTPGPATVLLFGALGLLGFVFVFHSLGEIWAYFSEPSAVTELKQDQQGNLAGFLGTVLRPFLAFAMVAWWARSADRSLRTTRAWRPVVVGALAAAGITLANLTFSFNRAAFVFPVVCLVSVYSARIRRIPLFVTAAAVIVLLPVLAAVGNYRASMLAGAASQESNAASGLSQASDMVQAYAGGPPLAGLFLEEMNWGRHLYGGSTLLASALSPVPILGKSFRDSSGTALCNRALYGVSGYEDQIIPFSAELFVNFHAAGVAAGFLALGLVLGRAELWFASVGSSFGAFAIQYLSLWCATLTVWSLSVFSQIAIYFAGPIYLYWAVLRARTWLRRLRVPAGSVAAPYLGESQ